MCACRPPPPPPEHRPGCAAEILKRSTAFQEQGRGTGAVPLFRCSRACAVKCRARCAGRPCLHVSPVWFSVARVLLRACCALPGFGRGPGQPVRGVAARIGAVVRVAVVCKTGRSRPLWIVAVSQEAQPFRLSWACRLNRVLRAHTMWGASLLMECVFKIDIQRRRSRCGVWAPLQLLLQRRLSLPLLAFFPASRRVFKQQPAFAACWFDLSLCVNNASCLQ